MIRQKLTIGLIASAFALSLTPAWAAQDRGRSAPDPQSGSRPSNGETVGSAQPRDTSTPSATSSSGASSGASSSSGSSTPSGAWMGGGSPSYDAPRAPHAERADDQRQRGSNSGSTGRAVPRGSSGDRGSAGGSGTSSTAGSNGNSEQGRSRGEVPTYSRPRDGRNAIGTAVERRGEAPGRGGVYYPGVIYNPYSSSYYYDPFYAGSRYSSYWSPYGYGYGLGYFSYDPFLFGGYGNNGYGSGGYGGGYGYDPYQGGYGGGYGYDPSQGGYSSGYGQGYREVGSLRLKVKPANAQVHVDGYYVGVIDSYDGAFQRLGIEAGAHRIEVRAEGYEPVQFEVMITPGETITYKGELKRVH